MKSKRTIYSGIFLIGCIFLTSRCERIFREIKVDKDTLLGYDYRLFQGTKSWDIAKAVWDDDKNAIKSHLVNDSNLINSTDPVMGHSLLMFTIWNQQYETFRFLLQHGANVNIHDHYDGSSAIIEACVLHCSLRILYINAFL